MIQVERHRDAGDNCDDEEGPGHGLRADYRTPGASTDLGRHFRAVGSPVYRSAIARLRAAVIQLLAFAFLGVLLYGVVRAVIEDPTLVGSLATASAAVIAVVVGRNHESQLARRDAHRRTLEPMYRKLTERMRDADPDEAAGAAFFKEWSNELVMSAPASVIHAWLRWGRVFASEPSGDTELIRDEDGDLIRADTFYASEGVLRAISPDRSRGL